MEPEYSRSQVRWFKLLVLLTQEVEIRRIEIQGQQGWGEWRD
jgi:hypothetical protein